ncbi:hypothetical protein BJF93_16800 [Xaviernesmea oryzae]|uniref:Uncharacterized protein n=1 Tax=Xaviernesmea oryzae TaxID=464029 RepID=A0A1Q9AT35_9HYPH|nr:hypothetical protein [Xaviernesmea oryzae]OLP58521.1 hypothetical protein BJF93_16800 [Xaviernesmea oryzae]SEK60420.1 hypothetical protein SAMN04487976_10364 [Xaviernesmea oryzae]
MRIAPLLLSALLAGLGFSNGAQALAAGDPPSACFEAWVLSRIAADQDERIAQGKDDVRITGFGAIGRRGLRPHEPGQPFRELCEAQANLADGTRQPIWFEVETQAGGAVREAPKVDFCLRGHDPDHVYGDDCRSLR